MCLKMRKKRSFLLWEQGVEGSNPFAPNFSFWLLFVLIFRK